MDDITWDRNEKSDANLNSEEAKLQSAELFTPYVIGLVANLPMAIIGKLPDDLKPQFEDFSRGIRDTDTRDPSAKLSFHMEIKLLWLKYFHLMKILMVLMV